MGRRDLRQERLCEEWVRYRMDATAEMGEKGSEAVESAADHPTETDTDAIDTRHPSSPLLCLLRESPPVCGVRRRGPLPCHGWYRPLTLDP
ncbi:hypothetical protein KIPB_007959 [Kipferlia bialata]|uniref:Uncharacterized protein n=1 Tax=Kipferlia bialata TaxID=797122 RepID=A0A9K3GJH4_9EUKA|nr:hypothetical protein KIPB_007959 [Kipferlia bialata]|eukprot:g7959.t1